MTVTVSKSFEKDILQITDKKLASQVIAVIGRIETSPSLTALPNVKKMQAKGSYYRIRLGQYRLGFRFDGPDTVILLRFMHRKDIYANFP